VLVLLVVFGFGAPGVGSSAQVDEPHRRVPPCKASTPATGGQVTRGSRRRSRSEGRGRGGGGECLAADCSRRAVGKQNRSGIVSAELVRPARRSGELADELGQVLGAGVVFEEERDVGSVLRQTPSPSGAGRVRGCGRTVVGGFAFAVTSGVHRAVLAACRARATKNHDAPVMCPGVGAFEGKLPVRADHRQPSFLVAVFLAEQRGADGPRT